MRARSATDSKAIISGDQNVIRGFHRQFERKCISVGDIPVDTQLGRARCTLTARRNDL